MGSLKRRRIQEGKNLLKNSRGSQAVPEKDKSFASLRQKPSADGEILSKRERNSSVREKSRLSASRAAGRTHKNIKMPGDAPCEALSVTETKKRSRYLRSGSRLPAFLFLAFLLKQEPLKLRQNSP